MTLLQNNETNFDKMANLSKSISLNMSFCRILFRKKTYFSKKYVQWSKQS